MRFFSILCTLCSIAASYCFSINTAGSDNQLLLSAETTTRVESETIVVTNSENFRDFPAGGLNFPIPKELLFLPVNVSEFAPSTSEGSTEVTSTTISVTSVTVVNSRKSSNTTGSIGLDRATVEPETTITSRTISVNSTTLITRSTTASAAESLELNSVTDRLKESESLLGDITTGNSLSLSSTAGEAHDTNANVPELSTTAPPTIPVNLSSKGIFTTNSNTTENHSLEEVLSDAGVSSDTLNYSFPATDNSTAKVTQTAKMNSSVGDQTTTMASFASTKHSTDVRGTTAASDTTLHLEAETTDTTSTLPISLATEPEYNTIEPETEGPLGPQCGQRFTRIPRIIGGSTSLSGEFPWAVSVRVLTSHYCGGVIINKDWVLTAGHCIKRFSSPRYWRIRLGGHAVNIDTFRPQWDIQVSKVVLHPSFGRPARYSYDMALLKLQRPIEANEFAAPVCLPENPDETYEGYNATVVGWGRTSENVEARPPVLQKLTIPVLNNTICEKWYKEVHFGYIRVRDFHICAGEREGGKDSCKGDSGGPLVVEDKQGRYTLVGIVSAGVGCGRSQLPGIYSRVSYFAEWILKVTGGYTLWPMEED